MPEWFMQEFEFTQPEISLDDWLDQHPDLRNANVHRSVKEAAYVHYLNSQGLAVIHDKFRGHQVAETFIIGISTEGDWTWGDWYGSFVRFGGEARNVPDMPTPDGQVTDDDCIAWIDHFKRLEQEKAGKPRHVYVARKDALDRETWSVWDEGGEPYVGFQNLPENSNLSKSAAHERADHLNHLEEPVHA